MSKKREKQTDSDLVREVKQGDPAAMEEIVKRYSNKVYNLAYHLTEMPMPPKRSCRTFLTVIAKIGT